MNINIFFYYYQMKILPTFVRFIQLTSNKYNIDESHGLSHSMSVLHFANEIYQNTVSTVPHLKDQEPIIYTAALLHDMCDKKYMDEREGIKEIQSFLTYKLKYHEIQAVNDIITTMSYSKVKKQGFPSLGKYQTAYHIVREADLLSAYDIDRSIYYHLHKTNCGFVEAYDNAVQLFNNRVLQHHNDELFINEHSRKIGITLHEDALKKIKSWDKVIQTYDKLSF